MSERENEGIDKNLRPEEAIQLAMERERRARDFYRDCAKTVDDPGVRKMFEFLAKEEVNHLTLLEREYDRFIAREG
jgi:rubrerythrin